MTGTSTQRPAPAPSVFREPYRTATAAILIIITLIAFEAMAVSAALPTAARDVHGLRFYGWAFTGFLLASVVGMVLSGQLCDNLGPRRPLAAGVACFLGGLIISGTATAMITLIAGRVVQGFGSGLLITAVYVVIGETYPARMQPKVFTATSTAWVLPSLVGPLISGSLTQHISWRLVFLGMVPFALIGAVLLAIALRRATTPALHEGGSLADPRRLLRALAVASGIALLTTAGQDHSYLSIGFAAAGIVIAGWGLRALLPAGTVLVRPGVAAPVALRGLLAGSFFGAESMVPLSLTVQHGYGATAAGLPLAGAGISWAIGSWWQGRAHPDVDDVSRRVRLMRTGFSLVALATGSIGFVEQTSSPAWLAYLAWALAGLGAGLTMSTTSVLLLRNTTDAERGADSAALQLSDSSSSAVTTGVAGVLVAAAVRGSITYNTAFGIIAAIMCGIAVVGALVAGRAGRAGPRVAARP